MDATDPLLSHQFSAATRLAENFEQTLVITERSSSPSKSSKMAITNLNLKAYSKFGRVRILILSSLEAIVSFRPTVVFYHMVDTHAAILSPIFRLLGVRQVLWYAHKKKSWQLVLASLFVNEIVTSTFGSFPSSHKLGRRKMSIIGQSIEPADFPHLWHFTDSFYKAISIGRLDPSKNLHTIVEILNKYTNSYHPFEITFFGSSSNPNSEQYISEIKAKLKLNMNSISLYLPGNLHRSQIPQELSKHHFFVHAYQGSLDKALLEATLVGIPVITQNSEYNSEMGTWSGEHNPSFESEFLAFLASDRAKIISLCENRRKICQQKHTMSNWTLALTQLLKK